MQIGIFSPYLDTMTGGEKYIFTAASCLSYEHSVVVFWDDPTILQKAEAKYNLDLAKVRVVPNIFKRNVGIINRLRSTLKYDRIIFLSDGSIPLVASKKLFVHFQFPVEWLNTNSFAFLYKKSRIAKIICNSHFTKKFIDKKFNTESSVLYPPAQTDHDVLSKKKNLILTVGRFSLLPNGQDFKKLELMVSAFKKFQKKRLKDWKLAIVTSVNPELEDKFEEFMQSIKSVHIQVYKNADFKQITQLYSDSKIYWHAAGFGENLTKYPERAEHFGISTVEAMSYGAVPIVINAGGQSEIVKNGENGYLWDTVDQLIEITHKVATDHDTYSKISSNARESSQNFSSNRFCEELNHLIW